MDIEHPTKPRWPGSEDSPPHNGLGTDPKTTLLDLSMSQCHLQKPEVRISHNPDCHPLTHGCLTSLLNMDSIVPF